MSRRDGLESDSDLLNRLGYTQELRRRMGAFTNFSVSFSIICILAGGITAFPLALAAGGGLSVFAGWWLGSLIAITVALSMAQIASAFPTAGGLYHWASRLGGRTLGWVTAWFNLIGLVLALASINVGLYDFFVRPQLLDAGWVEDTPHGLEQGAFVALMLGVQAALNHWAPRLTDRLVDLSGMLILGLGAILILALLSTVSLESMEWSRLLRFERNLPLGGPVSGTGGAMSDMDGAGSHRMALPALWAVLTGLILPLYTLTGFDASAHAAEETKDAARVVPKGIVRAVLWSALLGGIMVCTFVLALENIPDAIGTGPGYLATLLERLPGPLHWTLAAGLMLVNALCGLACMMSTSRMVYAFARDGGLPASSLLARVDPRRATPGPAIWSVAVAATLLTLWADAFAVLSTGCAVFLYLSYVSPIVAGLRAEGRSWQSKGPFDLGRLSRPCAWLAILGTAVLTLVGIQPPNQQVLLLIAGLLAALALLWWPLGERRRFKGTPTSAARD